MTRTSKSKRRSLAAIGHDRVIPEETCPGMPKPGAVGRGDQILKRLGVPTWRR